MAPLGPALAGAPLLPLTEPPLDTPAPEPADPGIATPLADGVPPVIEVPAVAPREPEAFDAPLSDPEATEEPEPPGIPFPEGMPPVEPLPLPQPASKSANANHRPEAERIVCIVTHQAFADCIIANPS
jgi:hypothetical protein